jgi:TolB-like protein/Flp pilus assembly protein TadD
MHMASDSHPKPMLALTWKELRRRKVVRVAIAYAAVAWIVLQLGEITFEPLGLPPWVLTWTILLVILAFPVVLVLAWMFEIGERGLTRDHTEPALGTPARVALSVVLLLTAGALAWWMTDRLDASAAHAPAAAGDGAVPAAATAAVSDAPRNSIAVLPFDDMSPDADQAWFADGLAEELLDRLARVEGLRVAARTSSFALRDSDEGVVGIGRLLNVATVLEGSVRKAEGRIRITAQLIDAGNGFRLWTETYERPDQGIFELQDEITTAIVEQLRKRIPGLSEQRPDAATQATLDAASTRDVQAHELYLQGRVQWRQRSPASLARAQELFEQAIDRDPGYARAWSGLADTHLLLADYGSLTSAQAVELAEPAAVKALELAPGLGEAWATLGLLRMTAGQYEAAEGNLLEAIRLDPSYEMASMWLGGVYGNQGKLNARADILEKALALSPLDPAIRVNLANVRYAQGDTGAARRLLTEFLAVDPDRNVVRNALSFLERQTGRLAEALRQADIAWRQDPQDPNAIITLAQALMALQRHDEAERVLQRLPGASPARPFMVFLLAFRRDTASPLPPELVAQVERVLASEQPVHEDDRPLLETVAHADYLAGNRDRALRILEKMAQTPPGSLYGPDQVGPVQTLVFALRVQDRDDEADRLQERIARSYAQLHEQGVAAPGALYIEAMSNALMDRVDEALRLLGEAVDAGFSELWTLDADPRIGVLRAQPRFGALRERVAAHVAREREASMAIARY